MTLHPYSDLHSKFLLRGCFSREGGVSQGHGIIQNLKPSTCCHCVQRITAGCGQAKAPFLPPATPIPIPRWGEDHRSVSLFVHDAFT